MIVKSLAARLQLNGMYAASRVQKPVMITRRSYVARVSEERFWQEEYLLFLLCERERERESKKWKVSVSLSSFFSLLAISLFFRRDTLHSQNRRLRRTLRFTRDFTFRRLLATNFENYRFPAKPPTCCSAGVNAREKNPRGRRSREEKTDDKEGDGRSSRRCTVARAKALCKSGDRRRVLICRG